MTRFIHNNKPFVLLMVCYLFSVFIVQPFGNYPLNDDWSYAKSVLLIDELHKIDIGEWPAMTLATHVVWGYLFTKLFGFSFLILRLSTWVSMAIGIFAFVKLAREISGNNSRAFVMGAVLLFNPIYYNMSNTFMTDVNFLTLLLLSSYIAFRFFKRPSVALVGAVLLLSLAITLLRQYGIVVPAAFMVSSLFLREKKWQWFALLFIVLLLTYAALHQYELYLKSYLSEWSAYKFSSDTNPIMRLFWDKLWYGLSTRYKIVAIHFFFHTIMFSAAFFPAVIVKQKWWISASVIGVCSLLVWWLFHNYPLQVGNVFIDTAVGTDTTYETLVGTYGDAPHFFHRTIESFLEILKPIFIAIGLSTLVLAVLDGKSLQLKTRLTSPFVVFICLLFLGYLTMIFVTESFFDRYQLPVIMLALLVFGGLLRNVKPNWWLTVPLLCGWMYISIGGTHDYFALNDAKWAAVEDLIKKEGVPSEKIQGSIEQVCWNQGNKADMWAFVGLWKFDYLLQFKREDSFQVYREYTYKRYWPVRADTVRVFKRNLFNSAVQAKMQQNDSIKQ